MLPKPFLILFTFVLLAVAGAQETRELERINPELFPVSEEKVTLRVLIPSNPQVENYDTNAFTKWFEEKTNVHVEWLIAQEFEQQLNLLAASGDLPNVILSVRQGGVPGSLLTFYGQQGLFLPLNDLIEEQGVEIKRMFELDPLAERIATSPDGNIYGFPDVNDCYHCSMAQKMWIYKPWLDKLGLDMPQTTEDFYNVLNAFKTQDPNGNGKADEIPLASAPGTWNGDLTLFLMSAFVVTSGSNMVLTDGEIDVTYDDPAWREGLRCIKRLYSEGLIAPESLTQDSSGLARMVQSSQFYDYVSIPPLEGPEGVRGTSYFAYQVYPGACVITAAAKNPEAAFR